MLDQTITPLLAALQACAQLPHAPFYAPGHKQGRGISQRLVDLVGVSVFQADLPELPELDNLFAPAGVITEAQQLAAAAFGAEQTRFLINGSTCGVMAAILATCGTGDKIILPRNSHQSAIAGLVLSGAVPIFINPECDSSGDLAHTITPAAVAVALQQHPETKAVMLLYPTYHGVCNDIRAIAQQVHQHSIPLLVDEAHGAHFAFHPDLPPSALSAGADLTIQSTHKVLGAMTQASMLHVQGNRIDTQRLSKALQLVQSTSPNYLLLASLDAARQQMALYGEQLLTRTLQLADKARTQISQIPGLSVLEPANTPSFFTLDRTRLTVRVSQVGLSGFEADEIFHQQLGVTAELPTLQHLTFIISLGNTAADIQQLVQAFDVIAQKDNRPNSLDHNRKTQLPTIHPSSFTVHPSLSPREAFFAPTETLPINHSVGQVSAELICPYPPGIPALMPGERIDSATLDYLQQVLSLGGNITGCSDPSLETLKVVKQQ
ncbi:MULTISPECIES: aminotransferase class I/II-fold pyridoxal phosphate-dependent enzyme [unclassified Coleofasciculus]|uniref:aminotransferase class I/II-fold pyridoxal phosphate-dependent enzyme n=1 Tax=unclassified Coleofasciculus TaxID=2692782 RepID=UPI0018815C68|nr:MULTISPECIES: aminotransferase class I/II-fold pyridoxal phosphate-dependent enzyme [unclassified Coleofasciculus]MBE9129207.1 aminotransferase class I/II-fold pyridoxal phosphate-dependent enzyme [Coleofasciculus sp. LEGE 07081]MBE9149711.1 aminotransferase class I/II-fold pyridoxal phosphate-dependent enzyme [Coleofasciculus sp. LEGE 07092]